MLCTRSTRWERRRAALPPPGRTPRRTGVQVGRVDCQERPSAPACAMRRSMASVMFCVSRAPAGDLGERDVVGGNTASRVVSPSPAPGCDEGHDPSVAWASPRTRTGQSACRCSPGHRGERGLGERVLGGDLLPPRRNPPEGPSPPPETIRMSITGGACRSPACTGRTRLWCVQHPAEHPAACCDGLFVTRGAQGQEIRLVTGGRVRRGYNRPTRAPRGRHLQASVPPTDGGVAVRARP
jgi:hypothetical protein